MDAEERRNEILHHLRSDGQDTMENLAAMYGVSVRTICRDISRLSRKHPIQCLRGKYGGVIYDEKKPHLSKRHYDLMERLSKELPEQDAIIMQEIKQALAQCGVW